MEATQAEAAPPGEPSRQWLTAALVLVLCLACYWPALHGGFLWDDDGHVTRPELRGLGGLFSIWFDVHATQQYYPLLHSAFWIEHLFWGDSVLGYHLANVLEHAAGAYLLVVLLRRLRIAGALLAGLLFAAHPVCVESVAWISEQKNTLSLVLYLLAALQYVQFDETRGATRSRRAYRWATALFAMAVLTKTVTATLPAALLVVAWWRRGSLSWHRDARPLVPWFALSLLAGMVTAWVERTVIGAEGSAFSLGAWERVLLSGRVVWFYLGKLAWPSRLVFVYPRWDAAGAGARWLPWIAGVLLVTAALWALRRRARGPLAAWLLYLGTLFPALGFINVYPFIFSYVADHFQYLASLGVFAAAAWGLCRVIPQASSANRVAAKWAAAALLGLLCALSRAQSAAYADEPTLYKATLALNPGCWMAHNNLGLWYKTHGEDDEAYAHYREALRLRPDYPQALNNLGVWYEDRGRLDEAAAQFRAALATWKNFVAALNNLGGALGRMPGHGNEAIEVLRQAVSLQPDFASAHNNLGAALARVPGHVFEAIAQYKEALRIRPDFADAHANLADAYSETQDQLPEAVAEYEESLKLRPDNAEVRSNLGLALNALGQPADAVAQYEQALRLAPSASEIRFNMALALLGMPGHEEEAAGQLEAFLRVHPGNPAAQQLLSQIRGAR